MPIKYRVTHNLGALMNQLNSGPNSKQLAYIMRAKAAPIIEVAQQRSLDRFNQHPVKREINAGSSASNISQSLGYGNLRAFLGFSPDFDPIEPILNKFKDEIHFLVRKINNNGRYRITTFIVSRDEIINDTAGALDWIDKSWVDMVENGFSNFGPKSRFKYSSSGSKLGANSQSGTGIQRTGSAIHTLSPTDFVTGLIEKLKKDLFSGLSN